MTALLLLPLLLPFALPPLARRALDRLTPVAALWSVTGCAVLLAGCSAAALGLFVLLGLLELPLFAALGELVHPLRTASDAFVVPAAAASAGALAVCGWALVRSTTGQVRAFRAARAEAGRGPAAGDLRVVDSPYPDAYALPGRPHRVVVTTAMLRSLDGSEREVLFAHERAHLAGGHHYALVAAELAAHCHPALRRVRDTVGLAAERAADEAAAVAVGDRRLTARAIARAALAGRAARTARPGFAPGAATGPVPQRVQALLAAPRSPRAGRAVAALLVACAAVSCVASVTGTADVHHRVEVAQGEERP
ncbi:M48 family metalloprotease [Streptomyces sp. 5-8]|uniref:M48 family metalloprotease n=1 Tax=Streptomyces musisoli TaxID=2802280 RepID=A0ABS1P9M6_9ACTN|nr:MULTISPECIES: M48 family metalloprotease [Streptomyces]MBL1108959.1 M48 family metalloprotease [Streptomyces musisoli]MBY8845262.1 M48 family metalloprotease [Streptomyces sp. SP2-10]